MVWRYGCRFCMTVIVVLMVLTLNGCASLELERSSEDVVEERASQRWRALIAKDWETAYGFSSPSYRALVGLADYKGRHAAVVNYLQAQVSDIKCQETSCELRVAVKFSPLQKGFGEVTTSFSERWVKDGEGWWLFQAF